MSDSHIGANDAELTEWRSGWDEENWKRVFANYSAQAEFAVSTTLMIGAMKEAYFKFYQREIRWINPTSEREAMIVIPINDREQAFNEFDGVSKLLSRISFETGQLAYIIDMSHFDKRMTPILIPPRKFFMRQPEYWHPGENYSSNQDVAMGLYREGINCMSRSPFYSFLSFYKVLGYAFREDKNQIRSWIDANLSPYHLDKDISDLTVRAAGKSSVGAYLYESCRCAIAHARDSPVLDTNNLEDVQRIIRDMRIIKTLAQVAISTKAGLLSAL